MRNFSPRKDSIFSLRAFLENPNYYEAHKESDIKEINLSDALDHFIKYLGVSFSSTQKVEKSEPTNENIKKGQPKTNESRENIKRSKHYKEISKEGIEENAEMLLRKLSKVADCFICHSYNNLV